jgi:TonB-linked SusC/RagA family outer membrane protein
MTFKNNIRMKERIILFFLLATLSVNLSAQNTVITGRVIFKNDKEAVIGASVHVKGNSSLGTVTDADGKFSLPLPPGTKALVFSYLGMKARELPIGQVSLVELEEDAQVLNEVVVNGMQVIDKRLFTGATTKIDAAKAKLDGVADISRSLEGRAAGVSVQNVSGTFGAAPKIRVRGATSIYGNSRPLWVVDGVVLEDAIEISSDDLSSGNAETLISSAIAGLNADDIESIQILKDGSATSIYGARAMAGVIVVTTKRGQSGVSRISYTGEFTYRLKPSYNNFNISNSQEQMGIYKEMEEKGWLEFTNIAGASNSGVYGKMYELIDTYSGNNVYALPNTQAAKNAFLRQYEFINTDWFDVLFNSNVMQNHSVSFTSGTEKARHYISMSVMKDPGWAKSTSVDRYTFNANGAYNLYNNLTLNMQGTGSYRQQKAPGTLSLDKDPVSGEVKRGFDINPYSFALNTSRTLDSHEYYKRNYAPFNILNELDNNYIDLNVVNVNFQGDLNWKIKKGWDAKVLGSIRYQTSKQEYNVKDNSNQAMAYRAGTDPDDPIIRDANPYLYTNPDDPSAIPESILPKGGIYTYTGNDVKTLDFKGQTTYVSSISDVHIFNLLGAVEVNSTERTKTWFRGWGYQYENGGIPFYDYMVFKQGVEQNTNYYTRTGTTYRLAAFTATGTYSYKGIYTVNGTARYEGTNKLGLSRDARWLPTWNISCSWNAHEESWFKNPVISRLTFRPSYSLTGDRGPDNVTNALPIYKAETNWRPVASVVEPGISLVEIANKDLTYEKKHELNLGIDVGFLNNRLSLTADYYLRNNFDLIGDIYTTGEGGGNILKLANVASMKSGGLDLSLSSRNIETKDFRWTTDFIFAKQYTKITDLKNQPRIIDLITGTGFAKEGYPQRGLFSIPFAGLNNEGLPTFVNENGEVTISDIYFQENKKLDYLKYEGPTDPTLLGSLSNIFKYKGVSLNVFVTYSFGNVVRLDPAFWVAYSDLSAMPKEFKNRWVVPGDENITNIPVIASRRQFNNIGNLAYAYNAYNFSDVRVAKGDFIRMKEIAFIYDFPAKWLKSVHFSNASLKLQATNLFLIYADKKLNGQDPEFYNTGGVATPMPKQFTLSVRFSL